MFDLDDNQLQAYIKEDLPYFDLTTLLQQGKDKNANLDIFTREDIMISCTEEAKKIAQMLGCEVISYKKSGEKVKSGEIILSIKGNYENIHKAWKLCQVLLEYTCSMTTRTNYMVKSIEKVNSHCSLLGTRKTFPLSKSLCIKAIVVGGAYPHRLGLSESILFFPQHRALYGNDEIFFSEIPTIKSKMPERKIAIESSNFKDSKKALKAGADVLQLDKVSISETQKILNYKNKNYPQVKVLSAGGINEKNVTKYASLGIDGIVTSTLYMGKIADISSKLFC